ncbi:MAG: glycosyltransferase family 4 protein [Candidatus Atabeyarchaeum deiterrae]
MRGRPPRVLHALHEVAGQLSTIAEAQRALGVRSEVIVSSSHALNYKYDLNLNLNEKPTMIKAITLIANFVKCFAKYDVFHFHFGTSLLPFYLDLPILKLFRKKIVMHYWGSEVRQMDIAANYTRLAKEKFEEDNDDAKRRRIRTVSKYANALVVGDYPLLPYVPNSLVIEKSVDLTKYRFAGCGTNNDRIRIVHAPSNRKGKGTKYVLPVIRRLKEEGYNIDFVLVENKPHEEALEIYREADIVIDQLLSETYGVFAVECMALGKPVLCRIDKAFVKCYPGLPILNTNRDNLYDNVKLLIENPDLRKKLGADGRKYVRRMHDSRTIARQTIELYKCLWTRASFSSKPSKAYGTPCSLLS